MNINPLQLVIGLLCSLVISYLAYKAKSLNRGGALAAAVLGLVVFGIGGWAYAVLLLGFFISSSLFSKLFKKRKSAFDEKFSKGSRRDAGQVLANGGVAGFFVLLGLFFPQAVWPWAGFAGAMAAANADTWATELGVLNRTAPRLITTGKPVEPGTSGGISLTGTLSAAGGSAFIALLGAFFMPGVSAMLVFLGVITLAGLLGSLVDSLLGATIQAIYYCPTCNKETERHPLHSCNTPTALKRGLPWMDNDWVNTFCTLSGALAAILLLR